MKKNTLLKKLHKELSNRYLVNWEHGNILAIQLEAQIPSFCIVLYDEDHPGNLIVSVALDFPDPMIIADITIAASRVAPLLLGEGFYLTNENKVLWGEAAARQFAIDANPFDIMDFDPPSGLMN